MYYVLQTTVSRLVDNTGDPDRLKPQCHVAKQVVSRRLCSYYFPDEKYDDHTVSIFEGGDTNLLFISCSNFESKIR